MNIAWMSCTEGGLDILRLVAPIVPISALIGLGPQAGKDVSGYYNMAAAAAELGMSYIGCQSYNLKSPADIRQIKALEIDVLVVMGWQRLVPEWLISQCRVGAIGSHGSADGISRGRGRSPQNWAILLGADSFEISIFFLDLGVDSGDIIDTRTFVIEETDDIRSCYVKTGMLVADMLSTWYQKGGARAGTIAQSESDPRYLPRRMPEDGIVDWALPPAIVARHIRALTHPYPGIFARHDKAKVLLWRARPLDLGKEALKVVPGEILMVTEREGFVVGCGGGLLLVDSYSIEGRCEKLRRGDRLEGQPYARTLQTVVDRHKTKTPDFPLSDRILDALAQAQTGLHESR